MNHQSIVALTGGGGGTKLVSGLAQILPPEELIVIVNTGDDFEYLGLRISPDLDKVMYTLAGLGFPGQGLKNESWNMMAAMARYAGPIWYQLGDRALATHLLRSQWLREGYPLNWITRELSRRLGVRHTILPMSEDPVQTMLQTTEGELNVETYFGRKPSPSAVTGIHYRGADQAQPGREVMSAIREADVIIFCPSDPLLSFGPMLAIPNLRRIIAASRAPKIGVSSVVGGKMANKAITTMMAGLGVEFSPVGVARQLKDVLTDFVLDHADGADQNTLTEMGLRTLVTATMMQNSEEAARLAREVLESVRR
ncbi:MAG: YvcK family protein [Anaerolineae bacterium]|nr:YvcK family protein [Anaerolineae bacterium]